MIYGYARVSSVGQAKDGNSLEAQKKSLQENGAAEIFSDTFTGTKMDRPCFQELLTTLKSGDTIVVTKLDRISRSASQGIALVDELLTKGVNVHILNMGRMDNTSTGTLIRNIMFAFAQFERDMIKERTDEGKAIAKSHGKKTDGRYKIEVPNFKKIYQKVIHGDISVNHAISTLGISRSKWYRLCKEIEK